MVARPIPAWACLVPAVKWVAVAHGRWLTVVARVDATKSSGQVA